MPPRHNPEVRKILQADRELSARQSDRILITLWWVEGTLTTYVTIEDHKPEGVAPEHRIVVPEEVSPNEVFYHPFAYMPKTRKYHAEELVKETEDGDGAQ